MKYVARWIDLILAIIIKIILEILYKNNILSDWSYQGFVYEFNLSRYIIGWFLFFICYSVLEVKKRIRFYKIFKILFVLYTIPNIIYFSVSNVNVVYSILLILSYMIIIICSLDYEHTYHHTKANKKLLFFSLTIVFLVLIRYIMITRGNYVIRFDQVYFFREMYSGKFSKGIFGYLNSWAVYVFLMYIFYYFINNKNKLGILISILLAITFYFFTGKKSNLEIIFIVAFIELLYFFKKRKYILNLLFSIVFILVLIIDNIILTSLIIRRLLFIPAFLNSKYYDFFSVNPKVIWSSSILKNIYPYPYKKLPSFMIGEYIGMPKANASTGFLANGYMNFGYTGMIIYLFILIGYLNLVTYLSRNSEKKMLDYLFFQLLFIIFISSDLLTALLTHGGIIIIFIYIFYRYKIKLKEKEK